MTKLAYGTRETLPIDLSDFTIGEVLSNRALLSSLGAPEGVVAVSGGVTLALDDEASSYEKITLEKRASSKAA